MASPRSVLPGMASKFGLLGKFPGFRFSGRFPNFESNDLLSTGVVMLSRDMIKAILRALDIVSDNFLSQTSGLSIPNFSQALLALFVSLFALFLSLLCAFLNLLAFRALLLSAFDGSAVPSDVVFSLLLLLVVGLAGIVAGLPSVFSGFLASFIVMTSRRS